MRTRHRVWVMRNHLQRISKKAKRGLAFLFLAAVAQAGAADPLSTEIIKLMASDAGAADWFGYSVGADGDVAIIGAYRDSDSYPTAGAAYIFERGIGGSNAWGEVKKLVASDAEEADWFGWSVAVAGDVAVVGAYGEDTGGTVAGAAYVFERNAGGTNAWGQVRKLVASDAAGTDYFGRSVAVAGDVIVVGAYGEDTGGGEAGAAYVFERNLPGTNLWGEVKKLMASDAEASDYFGFSVAVAGDTIVVGASQEDAAATNAGAAYIFERNAWGTNAWGEVSKLTASDAEEADNFGKAVAIAGDVAVISSAFEDSRGNNAGAAYVFERNAGGTNAWGQVKKLTASDAEAGDGFSQSVAVSADVVMIGAYSEDSAGDMAGAAYLFARNAGGTNAWNEVRKVTAPDAEAYDVFGHSVALAGDVAVVGAYMEDTAATNTGAAYIIPVHNETSDFREVKKLMASDAQAGDQFGWWEIDVSGDIAVVGARLEDSAAMDAGAAYLFDRNTGGTNAWGQVKKIMASDAEASDQFGYSVAAAGDVILIGAWVEDAGGADAGAAYIFERNAGGTNAWGQVKKLMASDAQAGDRFGISVSAAGEVVVIGAAFEDAGGNEAGAAYIFERNTSGTNAWGQVKKLVASDADADDRFGWSVAVDGDVAVISAYHDENGGSVYLFERNAGGTNNWGQTKKLAAAESVAGDQFGQYVAIDGDVVLIGDDYEGSSSEGAAYVFERNAGGTNAWGLVAKLVASDAEANDHFANSLAVAGDVALIGSIFEDDAGSSAGAVYFFERNAGGTNAWGQVKKLSASDGAANDFFATSAAMDGDVALIGAYRETSAGFDAGAAYVFELFLARSEVLVLGTNEAIVANNEAAAAAKGTDFGQIAKSAAATNSFSVTNAGFCTLAISSWSTNGSGAGKFSVQGIPSVAGGTSAEFQMVFSPGGAAGVHTAVVEVVSSATNTPYLINVRGEAVNQPPEAPLLHSPTNCPDFNSDGLISNDQFGTFGRTLNVRPKLIWYIPADGDEDLLHFKVYCDSTNSSTLAADSASDIGGFEYYNGTAWSAFPGGGVPSTNTGEKIRYKPQIDFISGTSCWWCITANDGAGDGESSITNRFVIGGRTWTEGLEAGVTRVRKPHVDELREEANYARLCRRLAASNWTDAAITANVTLIRSVHITELREAVGGVTNVTGEIIAPWTNPEISPFETLIRTNHIMELRRALQDI